jgi:predicted Abi (CAAX) family protease
MHLGYKSLRDKILKREENVMEPISLILTALLAGATAAAKDTATQAVKDAYAGLKALIQKKFSGKPAAEAALDAYAQKPEVWQAPVKDALQEAAADQDTQIVKLAQELMAHLDPQGAARGKFNVNANSVQGMVQGDHAQVTMNFGATPEGHRE